MPEKKTVTKKENVKKEPIKKETVKKETVKKQPVKKETKKTKEQKSKASQINTEQIVNVQEVASEINTPKKKIAFVASECLPFAATGGLGEVISSLPKALVKNTEIDVTVFLPLYSDIKQEYRDKMEFVTHFNINLAWRTLYCGIFKLIESNVTYYFIDNEYYFKRDGLYGYYDDGERFAFFCHAVLDSWPVLNYTPDILHAHDWQSALVPVYLATKYNYPQIKTVFTIHNIEYQGKYDNAVLGDIFDLGPEASKYVEYDGCINLMKGAIVTSNKVTTVSPTYAKELTNPFFAHGLSNIINANKYKLIGILNGIDTEFYNAQSDNLIAQNFSPEKLDGKAICKAELQSVAGLPQRPDVPVIAMISRLAAHKGIDLVSTIADELLSKNDIQFVILGCGDVAFEEFFKNLAYRHPDKAAALICYNKELSHKVYSGADMFLMPSKSEPCGLAQMIASRYGTVPIVRKTGGLCDSIKDCQYGEGNGFVFNNYNAHEMLNCIYSALRVYSNKNDFTALVKYIMDIDFSWKKSAEEYVNMYNSI